MAMKNSILRNNKRLIIFTALFSILLLSIVGNQVFSSTLHEKSSIDQFKFPLSAASTDFISVWDTTKVDE